MFLKINKLKSNKGSIVIMEIISILIVVMAFAMLADLIVVSTQYLHIWKLSNDISRIISIQGGVRRSVPPNYAGSDAAYYTSSEILRYLGENATEVGVDNSYIKINGAQISPSSNRTYNYGSEMNVEVGGSFQWTMLQTFIRNLRDNDRLIKVNKTVYAEYHY